ncbi:MAG: 2-amino-4-hydroxy-6-hydroxymethyldihydropteridine diphosphokinase [Vulcanibacillus sp.]
MNKVFLGLGSNIGDRYKILHEAVESLLENPNIELQNWSSIFETEPFGYREQPDFLNMVIEISTNLEPLELLEYINKVEEKHERKRVIHWGPRTIDIDILLYGNEVIKSKKLQIPHPLIRQRLFVLIPLAEIYSGVIPGEDLSIDKLIELQKHSRNTIKKYQQDF